MLHRLRTNRVFLSLAISCTIIWIYVYLSLTQTVLVSGDSGQWIMLARFYRSEFVPSYIKPMAYPPVYPVFLATAITLVGNAVQAVNLLGATVFVLLGISFFVVGKELWNSSAGFIAFLLGSIGQYFFLYATSWGAYPQLLFLAWANLAISRFVKINRDESASKRQYVYLGLFLGLGLFTHFPSAIVLVAVFGVPSVYFLMVTKRHEVVHIVRLLLAFSTPLIAWIIYVSFLINETIGYVENEAALLSRGVNTVWSYLFRSSESSALVVVGIAATAVSVVYASRRKAGQRSFGFCFVSLWLFSTVILMCTLYLLGVKTEYTRFTYLIVPPLVLNIAGAMSAFINMNMRVSIHIEGLSPHSITMKKLWWPLILVLLLLPFPTIHAFYSKAIQYYSVWKPDDFKEALDWLERNTFVNHSVLTTKKTEGRMLEGLTGRTALFSFPERASYRPWEHDRSIAADTILESTLAIENGYILVKFEKDYRSAPLQPSVSVCREGEYQDALWLRDSLTKITLTTPRKEPQTLSIRNLNRVYHEVVKEPEVIRIISRCEKDVDHTLLHLDRTITITRDSPTVSVHYAIRTTSSLRVQNLSIGILDPWGQTRKHTRASEDLMLVYDTAAQREMPVHVVWDEADAVVATLPLSDKDSRPVTWLTFFPNATAFAVLDLKIVTAPTGRLIQDLRFFEASQLIAQYNIEAALLLKDQNTWFKKINLQNIGFDIAFENDSYVVMVRASNA